MSELSDIMSEFMSVYTWDNHFGIGHFRNGQKIMCLPKPPRKSDCKRCKKNHFRHNHFRRLYAKVLISSLSLLGIVRVVAVQLVTIPRWVHWCSTLTICAECCQRSSKETCARRSVRVMRNANMTAALYFNSEMISGQHLMGLSACASSR